MPCNWRHCSAAEPEVLSQSLSIKVQQLEQEKNRWRAERRDGSQKNGRWRQTHLIVHMQGDADMIPNIILQGRSHLLRCYLLFIRSLDQSIPDQTQRFKLLIFTASHGLQMQQLVAPSNFTSGPARPPREESKEIQDGGHARPAGTSGKWNGRNSKIRDRHDVSCGHVMPAIWVVTHAHLIGWQNHPKASWD